MKNTQLILLCLMMLMGNAVLAQRPQSEFDKEKLESAKVAFITNRLDLKPEQAEKFWPLFNKYSEERTAIMKELSGISHANVAEISDSQAKEMIKKRFELEQKMLDREKEFVSNITSVISPKQALKLNHVNREFARQVYRMQRGKGRGGNNP